MTKTYRMFNTKTKDSLAISLQGKTSIVADIRIDGKLNGTINSTAKVVIGAEGLVDGNITALQADITGKVFGNLNIKEILNLRENAMVVGDIIAERISMQPTAVFNGKCSMKSSTSHVVEMVKDVHERKSAAE